MKFSKLVLCLLAVLACATADAAQGAPQQQKKTGILLVHYGTRNEASRKATIDRIDSMATTRFAGCEVVEAYAAGSVIKALEKQGVNKLTIAQALDKLIADGCDTAVVQSTMLLDGVMNDIVKTEVNLRKEKFKKIEVARPLLYSVDDCRRMLANIAASIGAKPDEQVVVVGHGSDSPANAIYSQLDLLAKYEGRPNWHVGTIESFPTLDNVMAQLAKDQRKNVVVVPLLFIAGNHNEADIKGVWGEALKKAGYQVRFISKGLGEMPEVQQLILDNINQLISNTRND